MAQHPNMNVWVTRHGLRFDYFRQNGQRKDGQVIDMSFVGGRMGKGIGVDKRPTITQFVRGRGFADTKTAYSYGEVKLASVYPGVDVRVYNDQDRPRYDLIVAPQANPSRIKMNFKGMGSIKVSKNGSLVLSTKLGDVEQRELFAYQMVGGQKKQVPAHFALLSNNTVGVELGSYDKSRELIIDPIVYGSYYGGDSGIDEVRAVTADADAGVYLTGSTQSPDFPIKFGPYSFNLSGTSDTYLAKLRGDAYVHEYSAYIGGNGFETGKYIALDPTGNTVWIAGMTTSNNFPGVSGASFRSAIVGPIDMFLTSFVKDATTVLAPSYSTYFGSLTAGSNEQIEGFVISPVSGNLVVGGQMGGGLPLSTNAYPGATTANAFVTVFNPSGQNIIFSRYHGGTANQSVGVAAGGGIFNSLTGGRTGVAADTTSVITSNAVAVDATDNVLITGTVAFTGNQDTATAPVPAYPTTSGVFPSGRLLRNSDTFIAKFSPTGAVIYSALLGGANFDFGSAVTVDESGNAYLTGVAGSFDFPRTTGTFGQVFTNSANAFVTKLNTDASQIVYSTNLRTTGGVIPTGIAVNQRGFAFITGVVETSIGFPNPPADPNVPNNSQTGTIQTTPDALRTANTFPAVGDLPATDGFLNILNSTAEALLYGTYIGGQLDEVVYAPFTDRVGDVWVMGYSDSARHYVRVSSTGTPTTFRTTSTGLDAGFITPLAFKSVIQPPGFPGDPTDTVFTVAYGSRAGAAPATVNISRWRDGFLFRFRLDIPLVQNLTLAPPSIAGGLGQTSTGTVTISGPAPAEGVDVVVSINNPTAASLDSGSSVSRMTVTIAPGDTTGTFTLFSNPVIDPSQVQVKAEYLGSFKIAQLTVNPWLNQLTLTPTTVVSGNTSTGRVTLFAPATEDISVTISTDNPSLISFPNGNTVTIPTGQQSANFPIQTSTVDSQQSGNVSASFLGKTRTQNLIVKVASLDTITFSPPRVAGGGVSVGTVTLDGNAPSSGAVIALSKITNPGNITTMPATVTVPAGQRSATFSVTTDFVPANTFSVVRATYNSTNRDATLLIDNISLSNFTINPASIEGGRSVSGTVTLNQPAPPGGAYVNISTANPEVQLPDEDPVAPGNQILVAANSQSRTFNIGTLVVITTVNASVSASRGGVPINRPLTITPVDFTISITPANILGGQSATMTITLTGAAPAGGVPIAISKSSVAPNPPDATGSVTVNGGNPVVIAAGNTSQTFPITTSAVLATDTVRITGQIATNIHSADLTIRAPKVTGLTFSPSTVRGLLVTTMTITLDGPAPVGGATIALSATPNAQIINLPSSVTVPAGATSVSQTITTNKVSRTLTTRVKATYGGGTPEGVLTVTR